VIGRHPGVCACTVIALCALAPCPFASASWILDQNFVVDDGSGGGIVTDFTRTISVNKFNVPWGQLKKVSFYMSGTLEGSVKFEHLGQGPATITTHLEALLTLEDTGGSDLVVVLPDWDGTDNVLTFDGTIDYGGTSGRTYTGITATESDSYETTAPADLAFWTGSGTVNLSVVADGSSAATGSGNLVLWFYTAALADVRVRFEYDIIPEPACMLLVGGGALALLRRRRRRRDILG